jgi:hypothetical protein
LPFEQRKQRDAVFRKSLAAALIPVNHAERMVDLSAQLTKMVRGKNSDRSTRPVS